MLLHCTRSAHIQRSLKYTTQLSFFTSRIHHTVHALCTPLHTIHNTGIIQPRHFSDVAVGEVYTQRIPLKKRVFQDRARIHVCGGTGGSGCSSTMKNPYEKQGPDGGNGGAGGSVYIRSVPHQQTFNFLSYHFTATNGANGQSKSQHGTIGKDVVIDVPVGTVVNEILGKDDHNNTLKLKCLIDLAEENMLYKLVSGGEGGLGNRTFKTDYRRQSNFSTVGQEGEKKWLLLELKSIADIGLIGYPNAGKSSLLSLISKCSPEIAPYPFTTLHPYVGIVEKEQLLQEKPQVISTQSEGYVPVTSVSSASTASDSYSIPSASNTASSSTSSSSATPFTLPTTIYRERFTMADLPGLISGASQNVGLGYEFLRHVERTKILLYVLDMACTDNRDPISDFLSLQKELYNYNPELLNRPALIFANKFDRSPKKCAQYLEQLRNVTDLPIVTGSCKKGEVQSVVAKLFEMMNTVDIQNYKQKLIQQEEQQKQLIEQQQQQEVQKLYEEEERQRRQVRREQKNQRYRQAAAERKAATASN